ncbi:hypothetical protein DEM27_31610 [Metarhizobium album]|uniref:Terminase small subunit n=1 Tax=Metarhizobium album TaxID=2182425 RepID=A0A2U2DG69_9HYPH|nr:hypothetical protein [Rhizobium album]PWE52290.1 hypothetical protein DEM27_31610 [Rhizobium album]
MLPDYLNQAGYAAHRDVSRKTVTLWKQRGLLVITGQGLVDVAASDKLLLEHGIKSSAVTSEDDVTSQVTDAVDIREEAARLVSADGEELWSKADAEKVKENYAARLKQLEYDRQSGAVVAIDDVVVAVAAEYAVVRNRLLGIGAKIAPDLTTLQSAEEIKAIIDAEVTEALNQLTVDVDGERDFDKLRESIQGRFGPSAEEDVASAQ